MAEIHTYVVLMKLTDEGIKMFSNDAKGTLEKLKKKLEDQGVKVLDVYALMGEYDVSMKVEAPDEPTLAKALTKAVTCEGKVIAHTATFPAMPLDVL